MASYDNEIIQRHNSACLYYYYLFLYNHWAELDRVTEGSCDKGNDHSSALCILAWFGDVHLPTITSQTQRKASL